MCNNACKEFKDASKHIICKLKYSSLRNKKNLSLFTYSYAVIDDH